MAKSKGSKTWSGTQAVQWPRVIVAVVAVLAIVFGVAINALYFLMLVFAVVTIAFTQVRVDVSSHGVDVAFGPTGWPVKKIPITEIANAKATQLRPLQWGGWGYRIKKGSSAVVLRKGSAIDIEKTNGKHFFVTVDDAEKGAAVLRGHLR